MKKIEHYIEKAKAKNQFKSDRQLDEALGKRGQTVWTWKNKNTLPNDETMERLAQLAGENPLTALIDLNMWRSKGAAHKVYQKMSELIRQNAHLLGIAGILLISSAPAQAAQNQEQLTSLELAQQKPTYTLSHQHAWACCHSE